MPVFGCRIRRTGKPDFRLGAYQITWIERELAAADLAGQDSVIFMHTYLAYLAQGREELMALVSRHRVVAVDMGHTHYNELANDGRTIHSTTRSTGQVEEGTVGFSMTAIDGGVVSWRFKPLSASWPWVHITTPADRRLLIDPVSDHTVAQDSWAIRAKIWGNVPIAEASFRFGDSRCGMLKAVIGDRGVWQASLQSVDTVTDGTYPLQVSARDALGREGHELLQVRVQRLGSPGRPERMGDGSDRHAVGAWPEKGILDTQLGPNRNGKQR